MYHFIQRCQSGIQDGLAATWHWFNGLHRSEWLVVLAITTVLGFFCMRGFGSLEK